MSKSRNLVWDSALIEDIATQHQFADLFDFSIPAGLDFVPEDESVHSSSVLVRHRESGIVHVDDTLMYLEPPSLIKCRLVKPFILVDQYFDRLLGRLGFHTFR